MRRECANVVLLEPVEYRLLHGIPALQVLNDNSLEQLGSHSAIPYPVRVHDDDWTVGAYSEAGRFAALHAAGAKQQIFALEKLRKP